MKNNSFRQVFGLLVAFSLMVSFSLGAVSQPGNYEKDDETLIKEARAELQTLLSAPPPSGSAPEASFKISVVAARQKLRDLLLQKKGLLRGSIRTLQNSSNPATTYLASLQQELTGVDTELSTLDQALSQSGVVLGPTAPPPSTPTPTPTVNYSRYRRRGDLSMDESFFPVVWDATGGRTPWLEELPSVS